jgi:lysozyme
MKMFAKTDEFALGVDVSHHQDPNRIDYPRLVDEANVRFAIVRIAYGGRADRFAAAHIEGFRKAGAQVGVYAFALPTGQPSAQVQRSFAAATKAGWLPDADLPFFLDVELPPLGKHRERHANLSPQQRSEMFGTMLAQLDRLTNRNVGIYTGPSYWNQYVRSPIPPSLVYWAARYPSKRVNPDPRGLLERQPQKIAGKGQDFAIWQYSNNGRLPGYDGRLDLNIARVRDLDAGFKAI